MAKLAKLNMAAFLERRGQVHTNATIMPLTHIAKKQLSASPGSHFLPTGYLLEFR